MAIPGQTEEQKKQLAEFHALAGALGWALLSWQHVEKAHFKLFLRMLGAPKWEVVSAAYYSIESFEARHRMVGRMAHYFMEEDGFKTQRHEWNGVEGGLSKAIKDANTDRNKLAHYGMKIEILHSEDPFKVELSPPKLQPIDTNLVDRLIGRTADNPAHNLDTSTIQKYAGNFAVLGLKLDAFQKSLDVPPPRQGLAELLASMHPTDPLWEPPPIPQTLPPVDESSSGQ